MERYTADLSEVELKAKISLFTEGDSLPLFLEDQQAFIAKTQGKTRIEIQRMVYFDLATRFIGKTMHILGIDTLPRFNPYTGEELSGNLVVIENYLRWEIRKAIAYLRSSKSDTVSDQPTLTVLQSQVKQTAGDIDFQLDPRNPRKHYRTLAAELQERRTYPHIRDGDRLKIRAAEIAVQNGDITQEDLDDLKMGLNMLGSMKGRNS